MPRPPVDRVPRNIRLRRQVDEALVGAAEAAGRSINAEVECAVMAWTGIAPDVLRAENGPPSAPAPAPLPAPLSPPHQAHPDPDPEAQAVAGDRPDKAACPHTKRRHLGYASRCVDCGTLVR